MDLGAEKLLAAEKEGQKIAVEIKTFLGQSADIYNLHIPADLVVLSACQTGLGQDVGGEGIVGLTRGFLYAKAARVMVSLWNVSDRATPELMTKFYQQMLQKGVKPVAAQSEIWQTQQWRAPYYWAAFVIQGEWK